MKRTFYFSMAVISAMWFGQDLQAQRYIWAAINAFFTYVWADDFVKAGLTP